MDRDVLPSMNQDNTSRFKVLVVTNPFSDMVGQTILANLIDVLMPICRDVSVISGSFSYQANKRVRIFKVGNITTNEPFFIWVAKQIQAQLKAAYQLVRTARRFDIVLFFLGGRVFILAALAAKLLRKKIIVAATGSSLGTSRGIYSNRFCGLGQIIPKVAKILERACFCLADQVAVESPSAIKFLKLGRYSNKIAINGAMYVDLNLFRIERDLSQRQNIVGFIGRLSGEKGVMNFVKAIPSILRQYQNVRFLIGGDGHLREELKRELSRSHCTSRVEFSGWISHQELPHYLNKLKVLVVPSYSEGVPGIVQEAMACGTLVLATAVGGIPDLVRDEESGFILRNNSPPSIATGVIKALKYPKGDEISRRAHQVIEKEYAFKLMVGKCQKALASL